MIAAWCYLSIGHAANDCLSTNIGPSTAKIILPAMAQPNLLPENTRRFVYTAAQLQKSRTRTLQGEQPPTRKSFFSSNGEGHIPLLSSGGPLYSSSPKPSESVHQSWRPRCLEPLGYISTPRLPPPLRPRAPRRGHRGHRGRACGPTGVRTPERKHTSQDKSTREMKEKHG